MPPKESPTMNDDSENQEESRIWQRNELEEFFEKFFANESEVAQTRINHILSSQSKELFEKYSSDYQKLYEEQVLPNTCKLAFAQLVKHHAVVTFSVPK